MTVRRDNKIDPVRRDANGIQIFMHIIKQMQMAGIYEDIQLTVNKIRIAVVLCISPPNEGMKTIEYFHDGFFYRAAPGIYFAPLRIQYSD
jgi:hypothetical protein